MDPHPHGDTHTNAFGTDTHTNEDHPTNPTNPTNQPTHQQPTNNQPTTNQQSNNQQPTTKQPNNQPNNQTTKHNQISTKKPNNKQQTTNNKQQQQQQQQQQKFAKTPKHQNWPKSVWRKSTMTHRSCHLRITVRILRSAIRQLFQRVVHKSRRCTQSVQSGPSPVALGPEESSGGGNQDCKSRSTPVPPTESCR